MAHLHFGIKSGKRGTAADHIAYITRKGAYEKRADLVDTGYGNLPAWSDNNPKTFFTTADKHERKNGSIYRSFTVSLPNTLSVEQNKALAGEISRTLADNKPYLFAVHDPLSALEGEKNPHVHLMVSDRAPDGIERAPEQTFRRYNPVHPEQGGRKKDSGGMNALELRDHVLMQRRLVAEVTNRALAELGHHERVDHRSLKAQGASVKPERHLGPKRIRDMTEREKRVYVEIRKARRRNDLGETSK